MFIFRLRIPVILFDCTLESKLLRLRYPRRGHDQLCSPSRKYFKQFGLHDAKMGSDEVRSESRHRSNRHESIMAVNQSH